MILTIFITIVSFLIGKYLINKYVLKKMKINFYKQQGLYLNYNYDVQTKSDIAQKGDALYSSKQLGLSGSYSNQLNIYTNSLGIFLREPELIKEFSQKDHLYTKTLTLLCTGFD